jgi:hypothetical protein
MDRPAPETLWRAIDAYLACAYDKAPPAAVASRLDALRHADGEHLYDCEAFERSAETDRLSLRLGNRCYPYMKLVIERAPAGQGYLFRADTHDKHAMPEPGAVDYDAFRELMEHNRAIAEAIEAAWTQAGVTTFKQILRADLERRRG